MWQRCVVHDDDTLMSGDLTQKCKELNCVSKYNLTAKWNNYRLNTNPIPCINPDAQLRECDIMLIVINTISHMCVQYWEQ